METKKETQRIYFLWDYNWEQATLLKTNIKTYKLFVNLPGYTPHCRNIPKEKCAFPDEEVCIVWETNRGKNGRGGYRIERKNIH